MTPEQGRNRPDKILTKALIKSTIPPTGSFIPPSPSVPSQLCQTKLGLCAHPRRWLLTPLLLTEIWPPHPQNCPGPPLAWGLQSPCQCPIFEPLRLNLGSGTARSPGVRCAWRISGIKGSS